MPPPPLKRCLSVADDCPYGRSVDRDKTSALVDGRSFSDVIVSKLPRKQSCTTFLNQHRPSAISSACKEMNLKVCVEPTMIPSPYSSSDTVFLNQQNSHVTVCSKSSTFVLVKPTLASYHQAGSSIFGPASGKQCVCISYCSILYHCFVKPVSCWNANDLHTLMISGSQVYQSIYRSIAPPVYPQSTELPKQ